MPLDIPPDIPQTVPARAKIYKDDCMYSFDTPESNDLGLDVDLRSYQAFARTPSTNFTLQNFQKTGNYLYLNINKTLKPEGDRNALYNEHGERNSKLAKLEVKDVNEDDLFSTEISIYNIKEDRSYALSELTPSFQKLVDDILKHNSSDRADEIKQWEQEILPCEHSFDLEQFKPTSELDLTHCSQCELKENLWICLHCGALGCGREQFGSTLKGNSHALKHFETAEHPVAIKLGSLSAESEDSCDAYCYKCNDEIKVPNLSAKLLTFGIDLRTTVKTEKSLVELNIDQNLNWDFKLDGANGEKLQPVFGKGLTGFKNLGNSCYLNSVIQALYSVPEYQEYFKSKEFPDIKDPAHDLTTQLIKIYDGLLSGKYSHPGSLKGDDYQVGIKPSAFKTLIGENHPEFSTQRQQDAHEFLSYFLDKTDNELGIELNKSFKFLLGDKVICSQCSSGSIKNELADNISVQIDDQVIKIDEETGKKVYKTYELQSGLSSLFSSELIEGYKCSSCGTEPGAALKSSGFVSYPKNLVVNAQRIKLENWVPAKIDVPIAIPYTLDVSEFQAPKFEAGESQLPQEEEDAKDGAPSFTANEEAMTSLLSMGFPEPRCLKGLYHTGNNNAEDAMNWIFAHMDDIDIDDPFVVPQAAAEPQGPSEEQIEALSVMGFSHQLSKKALLLNNNDANAAVEWLFANPDDDGVIDEAAKPALDVALEKRALTEELLNQSTSNGKYELQSVICHKGTSPHTGHYVVFIKKIIDGQDRWVLFNDEKVVVCDENNLLDMRDNGYIYIFNRKN
ncbi:ubiquitinyl hydrolase [Suhomyces tanzawaensis NRRL Y-17324]|uniref:Ubiquitin carboxyl-terminal hydrolase n=1 Tax=Suhomyces tanzawaensis NRRL Y-17324 TaxID=984487 RepID=A0A1E4SFD3_9ASCO|nr:ubiquitinyl hydrolase [Suhomyces tanzawaensis NRRL Y-17324]ODV78102.1 ubiquitinyl hydrolase [Suhomyces tanzawaensis NRRL Y-17324]